MKGCTVMEEIRTKFEEIKKLCEDAIPEYGEKSSYFREGATEEEIISWETQTGVKMPETYREWLKLTKDCMIRDNVASFYFPEVKQPSFLPKDYIMIGNVVGDGEVVCFTKVEKKFITFFEGKVNDEYNDFKDVLKSEVIRVLKGKLSVTMEEKELMLAKLKTIREKRGEI